MIPAVLSGQSRLRRLASVAIAMAVAAFWLALYSDAPVYPPRLGWQLAVAGVFFLGALTLIYQLHQDKWPGTARFGFAVSAVGLALWIAGGAMNTLGLRVELLVQPQPGWGLLCVGLIPIGVGGMREKLSLPIQLLFPLGCLFLLGPPLKYLSSERMGGMIVLIGFGIGWLVIGSLLPSERE